MNEIKDIFMDAFSLQPPDSSRPILEQLSNIVDQVNNEDHDTNAKLMEWSEKKFQSRSIKRYQMTLFWDNLT